MPVNPRLKKFEARRKALLTETEAMLDAADKESRGLKPEEQTAYDAKAIELKETMAGIEREHQRMEWVRTAPSPPPVETQAGNPPSIFDPTPGGSIGPIRPAWKDDPNKGFKSPAEFFRGVLTSSMQGRVEDERLKYLSAVGSDEAGTYSDPYGNFLVPVGFLPRLLQRGPEGDPTAGRTTAIPMATPKIIIPARTDTTHTSSVTGGLVVYRRVETQTVTATRMVLEQVELTATPLMGVSYATEELVSDSAISFIALLEAGFRTEFGAKILHEKIHGTGAGCMEGVLNAPCIVSVAKETGQTADTIVYQNIIKMRARCWGYGNAIWLYNQDCLPTLMQMFMPIGTAGTAMWQSSAREGEPDMILGRPAFATEFCPTVGDTGDILLGNWAEYLEGTYQPLQSAESLHVRFEYNERTFRFLLRNDGRCWWRSALTPHKSSATLSPFVKLDAR